VRGRERVALMKTLITQDRKDALEVQLQKIELNLSADSYNRSIFKQAIFLGYHEQ